MNVKTETETMLTESAAPPKAPQPTRASARIVGLDWARAIAILGMVAAHMTTRTDILGSLVTGIPSALFAVLAGVSMSIMATKGDSGLRDRQLILRGVILIVLGFALQPISGSIQVVLATLGAGFVLLHRVPRWSTPALVGLTVAMALGGVAIHVLVGAKGLWLPFIYGGYPLLTWMTYMLVGVILHRFMIRSLRVQLWVLALGILVTGFGVWARNVLGATDVKPWHLAIDAFPHSGGLIDVLTTAGASAAVIAACLLVARSVAAVAYLAPVQAVGSMSLTMYIMHLISGGIFLNTPSHAHYPHLAMASILFAFLFATLWTLRGPRRGPAESAMAWAVNLLPKGE